MWLPTKLFPLLFLSFGFTAGAHAMEVTADEWCPLNCQPQSDKPGYAIEILQAVFTPEALNYRVVPWKRALWHTKSGISTAIIGSGQDTAQREGLHIGQEPIGYVSDCLYVASGNPTRYRGQADDLNSLRRVGVVLGYVYTEGFKEWIERADNQPKLFIAAGDQPAEINLRKLQEGTLDGVIESSMVMDYLLNQTGQSDTVSSVGCDTPEPVYVAFGPKARGEEKAARLDQGLAALRRSGELAAILARYGLKDWKP